MEFETIKKDNRKKYIIWVIAILAIASVVFFVSTRANYKAEQRLNLINKTVNYSKSDLDVMSIKVQNSSGGYDTANTVPTSGYTLSSESYCEINGTKDTNISMEYKDGRVAIPVTSKGTKCYLYFDKLTAGDILLASKIIDNSRRGAITAAYTEDNTTTENKKGKIFSVEDDDGTSYVYAGKVDDNWVQFGTENGSPIYWRIIRINGDGTIRLIYNGTTTSQTGATTQIGAYKFSHNDAYYNSSTNSAYVNDNAYVGYMYGTVGSSTYNATHTNTNSSYVKQMVDEWYNTNLNKEGMKEKISTNTGFCGDRTSNTSSSAVPNGSGGYGTTSTYYGGFYRINSKKEPSLKCTNSNDLYTVASANKGNKALTHPVGLITIDEVIIAGGSKVNSTYYLYTGTFYWTMTPYCFNGFSANMFNVSNGGTLGAIGVYTSYGVRPVINLKADITFSADGDGTTAHPYVVV